MEEVMIYDIGTGKIVADSGGNVLYMPRRGQLNPDNDVGITCKLKDPSGKGVFSVGDKVEIELFEDGIQILCPKGKLEIQGVKSKPYDDYQADIQRWKGLLVEFSKKKGSKPYLRIQAEHEAALQKLEEKYRARIKAVIGETPRLEDQL